MKKTVAHLLPDYNPFPPRYPAGTELRVQQVAQRQQRYRPLVICGWFAGQEELEQLENVRIRRIRMGRAYRRIFQKITRLDPHPYVERMWHALNEENASIIHIHNEPKLLAGISHKLANDARPVIVHVANEKPLVNIPFQRVTRWVACSRYIAEWLVQANNVPRSKIEVIYTGVDAQAKRSIWELSREERLEYRRKFGVQNLDAKVLLFAGRLVKEKGVMELLDAFAGLRNQLGQGIELLIAGNVRESDDPGNEKAVYGKSVVSRISGMKGVSWAGSLAPEKVHEFLLAGDVFMLPSLWPDPFPTVMVEAAAAGLPIVAAPRGGIAEFLEGEPGFDPLTRPEDPVSLALSTKKFLDDSGLAREAGMRLRTKVETSFDWTRVCDDFEAMYDRLAIAEPVS